MHNRSLENMGLAEELKTINVNRENKASNDKPLKR
jgi:hypothetical protein